MNVPLLVAGSLSLLAAAIHGGAGEVLVVQKVSPGALPPSRFGGPGLTKTMIRVSWHLATAGFVTVGVALVLAGTALHGDTARAVGIVAAAAATSFALIILTGAFTHVPRALTARDHRVLLHPGPVLLVAVAVLAWTGVA
jgi:hypothetical protein